MSEARSLTPLSEADYDAIAGAVLETARGRWFMEEYAKRNRQADTNQLLTAIGRIERAVLHTETTAAVDPNLQDAAALILDLRHDLERLNNKDRDPSAGLAARIESAASSIIAATETIQEVAWGLREAGADDASCDRLDRSATEIYAATAIVEGTSKQIGKIADTIAMLDSNLRAFADGAHRLTEIDIAPPAPAAAQPVYMPREAGPLSSYELDVIEVSDWSRSTLLEPSPGAMSGSERIGMNAMPTLDDDIVFAEGAPEEEAEDEVVALNPLLLPTSEAGLRALDAMPVEQKLAYFA